VSRSSSIAELASAVPPRAQYGLIHGELGPDHVLIDRRRHPVIIDIEGVMFFDERDGTTLSARWKLPSGRPRMLAIVGPPTDQAPRGALRLIMPNAASHSASTWENRRVGGLAPGQR
jgi:hypothetical protein